MAERVEIMVVAKDSASQVMRGITSSFGELGNMISTMASGQALLALSEQFVKFGKESVEATLAYHNEVRALMLTSGESADSTARFIQVLDDFKISAQDAQAATRAMTKQGLAPNLETLAKLSDQYVAIQDPMEKNEFITKNLGRAGLQWAEALSKGGDALRAMGDAVDESLIPTQEALDQSREYEIAMDRLGEAWEGLTYKAGPPLINMLTDLTNGLLEGERAAEIMREKGLNPANTASKEYRDALLQAKEETKQANEAMLKNAEAADAMAIEHEKTKEELKAEEDAIKALTKANEEYLSLVGELAGNLTDYEAKHQAIQDELNEGKITLDEASVKWQQLAAEQEKATYKMILNMLQQRLAEDGLDAAETAFLLQQGVEWGIYSQTAVDQANAVIAKVNDMVASYNNIPASISTDVYTNYITTYSTLGGQGGTGSPIPRQGGGPVSAGNLYRVNETRTEYFQPSMSGSVIPLGNGNGGNGGITVVYSPMISTADKSEIQNKLLPAIIEGVRKARADRII